MLTPALLQSASRVDPPAWCVSFGSPAARSLFLLCDHHLLEWGLRRSVGGSQEPSPPAPQHLLWAGCCRSLLILCLLLGNFQESPGSLRERLHQLQLDSLACWRFFACSGEVRSFGNWFLVPCFLPGLSCCLQLRLLVLCLSSSLGAPPPSSFSVHLPLLWTTSYPRFEIVEI